MKQDLTYLFVIGSMTITCGHSAFRSSTNHKGPEAPNTILIGSSSADANHDIEVIEKAITAASCERSESIVSQDFILNFTERKLCPYGMNDNLAAAAGIMSARSRQDLEINLNPESEICYLELTSITSDVHYDDYLFINLNGIVILASEKSWADLFSVNNGLRTWDWNNLKGKSHKPIEESANYGKPYCYGDSLCSLPKHDAIGKISYKLGNKDFSTLASASQSNTNLKFSIVATGDNDIDDCDHSNIKLLLRVHSIKKK